MKEDYTFGVDGSWLVAPTRHGAHNWEGWELSSELRCHNPKV